MSRCPRCGKETVYEGNPFRPFCSERCRLLDLGNWLSESYAIPAAETDDDQKVPPLPDEGDKTA